MEATEIKIGPHESQVNKPNRVDTSPHPKPDGNDSVEFYLGRTVRGTQIPGSGHQYQDVNVNGYSYRVYFGKKNTVPRAVYEVFKNAQSRSIQTLDDRSKVAPGSKDALTLNYSNETVCDYDIELLKEGK